MRGKAAPRKSGMFSYRRAMAELGSGPHRSGNIADKLRPRLQTLGPV
jgi:hypothetical protein